MLHSGRVLQLIIFFFFSSLYFRSFYYQACGFSIRIHCIFFCICYRANLIICVRRRHKYLYFFFRLFSFSYVGSIKIVILMLMNCNIVRPSGQPCLEAKEFNLVRNMLIAVVEERYRDAGNQNNPRQLPSLSSVLLMPSFTCLSTYCVIWCVVYCYD